MSSRKPARTARRRLLKVISLGIAGLVAGLLSGCSADTLAHFSASHSDEPLTATPQTANLDYHRTPEIRRAPILHHNQQTLPQQRRAGSAYAAVGEIDAIGRHSNSRYPAQ